MESLLNGIPGVVVYIDDILVTGTTTEEHLKALDEVLSRLEKAGLCLQKQKCSFMQTSVTYLGHCIEADGIRPFPEKVGAVWQAPQPKNAVELRLLCCSTSWTRNAWGALNIKHLKHPNNSSFVHSLAAYEYTLLWRPTKQHENADATSRLSLPEKSLETPLPAELVLLIEHLEESPVTATQIRMWTRRDPLLSRYLNTSMTDGQINVMTS